MKNGISTLCPLCGGEGVIVANPTPSVLHYQCNHCGNPFREAITEDGELIDPDTAANQARPGKYYVIEFYGDDKITPDKTRVHAHDISAVIATFTRETEIPVTDIFAVYAEEG